MPQRTAYIERDGEEIEITVAFTRSRYYPPSGMFGPPEDYDPGGGGEADNLRADLDGQPIELTDDEQAKIYAWLDEDPTGELDE